MKRCDWRNRPLDMAYHDAEWAPVHDDRLLFEMLILEGAQAGLSWSTILNKRARVSGGLRQFEAQKIAAYTPQRIEKLLGNPGIVRHWLKIAATVENAKRFLAVQDEFGSFDAFIWSFVGGKPLNNKRVSSADIPTSSEESAG